jgi:hypothetical protein
MMKDQPMRNREYGARQGISQGKLSDLGLTEFETSRACIERNIAMLRRLANQNSKVPECLARCRYGACANSSCLEGCHIASRTRRFEAIASAVPIFDAHPGPMWQVTVVHPRWKRAVGKLNTLNVAAIRQWNYRRLAKLGRGVIALGICEASLNRELDTSYHWQGEVQQIVAGVELDELKTVFADVRVGARPHASPVMINKVMNLPVQLAYAQKHWVEERAAYISKTNGRCNRRHKPPKAAHWAEPTYDCLRYGPRRATSLSPLTDLQFDVAGLVTQAAAPKAPCWHRINYEQTLNQTSIR